MKRIIQISFLLFSLMLYVSCETGPSLVINGEKSYSFTNQGGTQYLSFVCNRDWFVSSSETWCTVSPSSGVASDGTSRISVVCEPNLTYDPRSCVLTVNTEGIKESITVEQDAAQGLILSPSSFDISNAAQSIEVEVQANVEYTVTIASDCEKWISRTSSKGLSSTKLYFSITENTDYDSREGKITIVQKNGTLSGSITIHQAQKDGLFVDTQQYEVSEENQPVSVKVKANVAYEVISEVEWIKYVETKALKESTATLHVEANNSTFERSGKVLFKQKDGSLSHLVSISQQARPDLKSEDATDISLFGATLNGTLAVESAAAITSGVWFLYSSSVSTIDDLKSEGTRVVSTLDETGRISKELTGLSLATTYHYVACAQVNGRNYYGDVLSFTTSDFSVNVTTMPATDVRYFSSQLRGLLKTQNADSFSKDVWFLYSPSASTIEGLVSDGIRVSSSLSESGEFVALLKELEYGTNYYYAACTKVQDRVCYGEVISFSTQDFSATVSTSSATNLTLYKASLHGNVSFNNADTLPKQAGFIYSDKAQTLEKLIAEGTETAVEIDIDNGFRADLSKLKCGTKYYYVAHVKVYDKEFYGEVRAFSTNQLPEGAVDMGLSVAWASCNVGANSPEEYGEYYAWGEVETKEWYNWDTYKWGDEFSWTKYNDTKYGDYKYRLDPEDDVARVKLGVRWHMPTTYDIQELLDNCSWVWMSYKGVNGYTVTSNVNGNKIFLPAAGWRYNDYSSDMGGTGYYRSIYLYSKTFTYSLLIDNQRFIITTNTRRYGGMSVRAVTE